MLYVTVKGISSPILRLLIFVIILFRQMTRGHFPDNQSINCTNALSNFAQHTAQFMHCAIVHARPIKLCESCVECYTNVTNAYEEILKLTDESGESCRNKLINVDRLEIIENGYMYTQNLWKNGHCDSCYELTNGTIDKLSNDTLRFELLIQNVRTCLSDHYANDTGKYNPSVCGDCGKDYDKMNDLYEKLKINQGDGNVCVDIIDSVNTTRTGWSQILQCDKKEMKFETQLIVAIVGVSALPLIFYLLTKHLTSEVGTRLTQQKRLVQTFSINAPSTSR